MGQDHHGKYNVGKVGKVNQKSNKYIMLNCKILKSLSWIIVIRNRKMETLTKLAVLRTSVEIRAILEPILLYHAS